ncbi:MAG: putative sulfate exporter family transporter [Chthoniobacterales bacterium]|nr:putative sulfate exporter family transporter [Chthoniobacterales bacterium]
MKFHCPHFRSGVALTCFIAVLAMNVSRFPGLDQIGVLALALLLGLAARILLHIPEPQETGIHFSAKELLRVGTVLVGVRCNFDLLVHVGPRMIIVVASVVVGGLLLITWLGRCAGLSEKLSLLLAIDTSICGASAVASVAPTLRATKEEVALVIPLGSLIGTVGMLGITTAAHLFSLTPMSFGILSGATLHEVAQVIAAVSALPASIESGIATKFLRVLFLAPTMLGLGFFLMRRGAKAGEVGQGGVYTLVSSVWFVFGFLIVGAVHTIMERWRNISLVASADHVILSVATFLMTMAMAGVGLQVRLKYLRQQGWRILAVAVSGWLFLVVIACTEIHLLHL